MPGDGDTAISVLVRFGRLASAQGEPADILPLLVEAATEHAGATAGVALRVTESGRLRVVAARGCPRPLDGWEPEADAIGPELAGELLTACGIEGRALELPLVSSGDLFGVLVLIGGPDYAIAGEAFDLAQGLADLAATFLDRNEKYAELARSYVQLRASREALAQGEKLRALGQMAAGISHDLKNILNPLSLQLEVLKRRIARDPGAAAEVVGTIADVVRHGLDVVDRLRAFSRQDEEEPESSELVELDQVMATAIELCRPRLGKDAAIRIAAEPGQPPPVVARTSELVTAVVNLVFNAIDALEANGGRVAVRTGSSEGGAWIEVEDDGPGMAAHLAARVFEPFFTTKPEGTGLGLAMVYAFVQRHRGRATLDSAPGRGTRIRLWFPAGDRRALR